MRKKTGAALLSAIIPGLGQFYNRQWLKGLVFLLVGSAGIYYIAHDLMGHLHGLITLGEFPSRMVKVGKLTRMVEGDHSIFMMINGLMALLALLFYTAFHLLNIRDAFLVGAARERKEPIHSFAESLRAMGRRNFAYLVLAIPFVAVVFLTILPLVFSVLLAFTNYADPILPPAHLVDWVGFGNFNKMLSLDVWSSTFGGSADLDLDLGGYCYCDDLHWRCAYCSTYSPAPCPLQKALAHTSDRSFRYSQYDFSARHAQYVQ